MPNETEPNNTSKGRLTRRQIAQRIAAAKKSTGPRTLSGKVRSATRGLKHGRYAGERGSHLTALHDSMVELGEDPDEFYEFYHGVEKQFKPSGLEQAATVREIAWLHWERQRLERAQAAVLARRVQELEVKRQRKSLEISQKISAQLPAAQMNIGYLWADESPEKFQKVLELLDQLKQCANAGVFAGADVYIDWIYGPVSTARGGMIKVLFAELTELSNAGLKSSSATADDLENQERQSDDVVLYGSERGEALEKETGRKSFLPPSEEGGVSLESTSSELGEPSMACANYKASDSYRVAVMKLRRELETEIASVTQQYWLYQRQYVDVTPSMRAECLVPTIDQRWLMRQLAIIDRNLDRKVRLIMDQKRLNRNKLPAKRF